MCGGCSGCRCRRGCSMGCGLAAIGSPPPSHPLDLMEGVALSTPGSQRPDQEPNRRDQPRGWSTQTPAPTERRPPLRWALCSVPHRRLLVVAAVSAASSRIGARMRAFRPKGFSGAYTPRPWELAEMAKTNGPRDMHAGFYSLKGSAGCPLFSPDRYGPSSASSRKN